MGKRERIADVFKWAGQPVSTYVNRDEGRFEQALADGIEAKGQLCLLTGPSKTGKTTLYKQVLQKRKLTPLVIRCSTNLVPREFSKLGLEQASFDRVRDTSFGSQRVVQGEGEASGSLGIAWLAGMSAKTRLGTARTRSAAETRTRELAEASPQHLIPILRDLGFVLVVEDFHYLSIEVQKTIFQQWKFFVDNEITVLVIETRHCAADIASANRDLIGRVCQIDVNHWTDNDLRKIVRQGFDDLSIAMEDGNVHTIAEESAGLPIITQQICHQIFADKEIDEVAIGSTTVSISEVDLRVACHNVARVRYKELDTHFQMLAKGPSKRIKKYNTYEYVLSCFAMDPIQFVLEQVDIDLRLNKLPAAELGVEPPRRTVNTMLEALQRFQNDMQVELLEWRPKEAKLYMLGPSFLFFLRWRRMRTQEEMKRMKFSLFIDELRKLYDERLIF